jgi:trans-aconitate 2-methyltransferase
MREWNADAYHRVSDPQLKWGIPVLARLPLQGDELVVDVGCGTGRLTELLLERLPRGRVLAVDLSVNMVAAARSYLAPRFDGRIRFARADAAALPIHNRADAIFSTATFHWVLDHPALFRSLHEALVPGGRLVAQCGGGPNIKRVHDRCNVLMASPRYAASFAGWRDPWEFADAETTARRLHEAGFVGVETSVEYTPVLQPDAKAFAEFVGPVICRPHLAHLPDEAARREFMRELTELAATDDPPYELDYWRLNMAARKPG